MCKFPSCHNNYFLKLICSNLDANKACLWYLVEVSLSLTSSTIIFGQVFCSTEEPTF